jgi:hypothetical protein
MKNKQVCILGRGPSINFLPLYDASGVTDFLLMNDHRKTVNNEKLLKIINNENKKVHLMSNNNRAGFTPEVFSKLDKVDSCIINRLYPDIEKWQHHKELQRKNQEGGVLNDVKSLPPLSEDEPYAYAWRGPTTNEPEMFTSGGHKIKHVPNSAEQFLLPVANDKIICNCSYYATLYSILELKATKIVYFGIDFYNHLELNKKWFMKSPSYSTPQWWDLRMIYEGQHMKLLWKNYLTKFFPNVSFEIHTTETDFKSEQENLKVVSLQA